MCLMGRHCLHVSGVPSPSSVDIVGSTRCLQAMAPQATLSLYGLTHVGAECQASISSVMSHRDTGQDPAAERISVLLALLQALPLPFTPQFFALTLVSKFRWDCPPPQSRPLSNCCELASSSAVSCYTYTSLPKVCAGAAADVIAASQRAVLFRACWPIHATCLLEAIANHLP